ncbi:unnamed protein product [Amoebophrya sp. A25]|nr:unnamed protein product [Amoebophrya sp. A25]|eukprot:GSA25T00009241001.1
MSVKTVGRYVKTLPQMVDNVEEDRDVDDDAERNADEDDAKANGEDAAGAVAGPQVGGAGGASAPGNRLDVELDWASIFFQPGSRFCN